ncbi:MAG: cysteine--tRNA ligase [Patescibacteria group bacterium]|nr:cysteine--tRNA ligase [Patescibacteria group bacterium]
MRIYNSLSRKVEEFNPIKPGKVGMYICGPTVYDYAHIGHSRTYINSDVLIRVLRWLNFQVKPVMNITDVGHLTSNADEGEDKMEKRAELESKTILEIAKFYTDDFWQMEQQLNIIKPDIITPATKYIMEMVELIKRLEKKGFIYQTKDGIYFDTSRLKDYGKLAQLDIKGLKEGQRVDKKEKKNLTDFALWKFSPKDKKRQMDWPSPWGIGFPGWHIECSAMSMKYLGESLDIHTGGVDHIPVHHTNEIAQSEAATGKQFVKYWFHSGVLMVENEKMSKSLGNYIRVQDLIDKGFEPMSLRYLFLTSHYRTTMNFTFEALKASQEAYKKLKAIVVGWQGEKQRTVLSEEKLVKLQGLSLKFREAVENDLNLPQALALVWEMAKSNIPSMDKLELMADWEKILGLELLTPVQLIKAPEEIKKLMQQREILRKQKKWAEADELRVKIIRAGFEVVDKVI